MLAGMGGVSRSELVAAVSNAGGFGFLGMVREPIALIWREVESLREQGYTRFGVNIIPAATDRSLLDQQIATIIELHVPVVALFWDIDVRVVALLHDAGIVVTYQVGSVDEAVATERAGAEIIIAQGIEAGGHVRGTRRLADLLPEIVNAVRVPVLAAGGLSTGGDLLTAQALGADGIVLGSALLATTESFAHAYHKDRLVAAEAGDTSLTDAFHINWPPGAPVRVLTSDVTDAKRRPANSAHRVVIGEDGRRPIYLFSTDSPLRSMTGDFAAMALYAGTGVGHTTAVAAAGERLRAITSEADELMASTEGDEIAELSSAVCYVGEATGAYAGLLDTDEAASELRALEATMLQLLRANLTGAENEPPFPNSSYTYAAWVAALRQMAGTGASLGAGGAVAPAQAILQRLSALLPRLPEGSIRRRLLRLRELIEAESVPSVAPTASSSAARGASDQ